MLVILEAICSAVAWFAADRWTKSLVDRRLAVDVISLGRVGSLRRIVSRRQHRSSNNIVLISIWCGALVCAILLRLRLGWFDGHAAALGLGAAFGGAAGNLFDVIRDRPIIDFIDLSFWPAFNMADVAIVVGLLTAFFVP
jgi:signal peptidase II